MTNYDAVNNLSMSKSDFLLFSTIEYYYDIIDKIITNKKNASFDLNIFITYRSCNSISYDPSPKLPKTASMIFAKRIKP